jgi:hypothetical protein
MKNYFIQISGCNIVGFSFQPEEEPKHVAVKHELIIS